MLLTLRHVSRRPRMRELRFYPTDLSAIARIRGSGKCATCININTRIILSTNNRFQWELFSRQLHTVCPLWSTPSCDGNLRTNDFRADKYHPSLFLVGNPDFQTQSKVSQIKPQPPPPQSSVEPPEEPDKDKIKTEQKKLSLWQKAKKEIVHYYHGFRLLGLEVKIASGICFRLLRGHSLTRRERKQLVRTVADIIRLVPFAVFIIVPFMEFLLPFYLKFFPFMLPSTFKDKSSEAEKIRQRLKAKLEMTRFLQETLHHTTGASSEGDTSPSFEQFQSFLKKVQESGQPATDEEITRFSKLFEDQITLDSLEVKQLKMLCQILSLPTIGPSNLLRFQLWMRVRQLKAEDRLLAKEGVDQIPTWELQGLCQDRGMRSAGLTEERLRNQLAQWLNLHLEKNVPVTLLLFSRALHVSKASVDELPLKEAIAQLPSSASEEATARVLENRPPTEVDPRTKIELLRKEQASIKAARVQREQELAEQKKVASEADAIAAQTAAASEELVDQAPVVKGLPNEELEVQKEAPAAVLASTEAKSKAELTQAEAQAAELIAKATETTSVTPPKPVPTEISQPEAKPTPELVQAAKVEAKQAKEEEEPEITVVDLAQIETAISESSDALREEALAGLKEEVAETATKHEASLISTERVVDKRTTKAAQRLASSVGRMIGEMDSMISKLVDERQKLLKDIELREVHVKHSTEPTEQSAMLDAIKADHDRVIDINDLLLALRRIQKVPDDTRWQKILEVLDEDHDGKIEMQHVLSLHKQVIELLGSENVKLSSKEIKRVLEMIDNEQLAEVVSPQAAGDSKKAENSDAARIPVIDKAQSGVASASTAAGTPFGLPKKSAPPAGSATVPTDRKQ